MARCIVLIVIKNRCNFNFLFTVSFVLGMIMAFKPNGIEVQGVLLKSDTTIGNLNFYKSVEGFLEAFPQSIYQISIVLRSTGKALIKMLKLYFTFTVLYFQFI